MRTQSGGEAQVPVPGACLPPSQLRALAAKRLKRRGRFSWSRTEAVGEEILLVPYYYFHFINPKHRNRFYLYSLLVDGILGFSEFIRGTFELRGFLCPPERLLEKTVAKDVAEAGAREAAKSFALRRQSLWVKEIEMELKEAGELYYPYWITYVQRPGSVELLALNGLTGNPATPRAEDVLRAGIARAEWLREGRQGIEKAP